MQVQALNMHIEYLPGCLICGQGQLAANTLLDNLDDDVNKLGRDGTITNICKKKKLKNWISRLQCQLPLW